MKIAIISDIHENFHNLILALQDMERRKVEYILCLGDLMNSGVAKILSIQAVPVHLVWGNNDGERVEIVQTAGRPNSQLSLSVHSYDFITLGERHIFMTHYDDLAIPMAQSACYDAVFYGHTHRKQMQQIGNCLVVNPGELAAYKTGIASYAIYDTHLHSAEIIVLPKSISLKSNLVDTYLRDHHDALGFRSQMT